jgi:hypothetical protein
VLDNAFGPLARVEVEQNFHELDLLRAGEAPPVGRSVVENFHGCHMPILLQPYPTRIATLPHERCASRY